MIALLEMTEVIPKLRIVDDTEFLGKAVELVERLLLKFISQPGGNIPFLVCP